MFDARGALLASGILLCSCGKPLVTGTTLDTPVFSISGDIRPAPAGAQVKIGVLWVDPTQEPGSTNFVSGSELVDDQIGADGHYALDFYGPPPEAAIHWLKSADDSASVFALAWGEIVLYEDRDGDGTFEVGAVSDGSPMQSSDLYRGMALTHIVFYVEQPLAAEHITIPELAGIVVRPGYGLGRTTCTVYSSRATYTNVDEPDLKLIEPSRFFPDLRECLKPHPSEPVGEPMTEPMN